MRLTDIGLSPYHGQTVTVRWLHFSWFPSKNSLKNGGNRLGMGELRRDGQGLGRKGRALPPKRKREHERRSAARGDRRIGDIGLLLVKRLTALKTIKAKMGCIPTAMALKTIKANGLTNVWFYHDNQARE